MDLADLVPSLKRAVAAPGEFDTFFPDALDTDLTGQLADAVAETQFDGFLSSIVLDVDTHATDVDLTPAMQALVVMYAAARVLSARVANLANHTRYKAGNVEAESEQSASVLVELLKETNLRKRQILDDAKTGNLAHAFVMVDMYRAKSLDWSDPDIDFLTQLDFRGKTGWAR